MTRIFVAGANGNVGMSTTRALREAGASVSVGVRNPEKGAPLKQLGADVVLFDYSKPQTLRTALAGVDALLLITPLVAEPNVLVRAAVEAAQEAHVKFILRLSGSGADANSPYALARDHGVGEQIVRASGVGSAIIRPSFFMDNLINFAAATIRSEGTFYGAAGEGKVAYISSRDIGLAAAAILRSPGTHVGKDYNLTGPAAVTEAEAAQVIGKVIGKDVKYVSLAPEQYAGALRGHGLPDFMVDALVFLESVKAQGWAAAVSSTVEEITGKPRETLGEFIARHRSSLE